MKTLLIVIAALAALGLGAVAIGGAVTSGQEGTPTPTEEEAWLGAMLVQTPDGVTVAEVIADSPAHAAGLQRADVIDAVDGIEVDNVREFRDQLADKNVGGTITLTISRDGQAQDVSVTLEARPEPLPRAIPLLPELEGIPPDELFGHVIGGEFEFTDEEGNSVTAVLEAGTVASVDADAGTLTVDLNVGGAKTYTVEDDDLIFRGQLSDLRAGDKVTVMTVGDDVRAVFPGGPFGFIPGLGGRHGGPRHGPGGFGGPFHGPFDDTGDADGSSTEDTGA